MYLLNKQSEYVRAALAAEFEVYDCKRKFTVRGSTMPDYWYSQDGPQLDMV